MRTFEPKAQPVLFEEPLAEGAIVARPNRFIMDVAIDGAVERCHCPVVSRIGDIDTAGRPCLVSHSHNPKRKFPRTVEAFSLDQPSSKTKRWIGINQNASNRYVEHFLHEGAFDGILRHTGPAVVRRETPLGQSRLDFLVNNKLYLEVKTPMVQLQTPIPSYVPRLPEVPFSSTERALRHLRELAGSLANHERAVILYCLYYNNTGFRYYHGTTYDEVCRTVETCKAAGVELWQADFAIEPTGVQLCRYYELESW